MFVIMLGELSLRLGGLGLGSIAVFDLSSSMCDSFFSSVGATTLFSGAAGVIACGVGVTVGGCVTTGGACVTNGGGGWTAGGWDVTTGDGGMARLASGGGVALPVKLKVGLSSGISSMVLPVNESSTLPLLSSLALLRLLFFHSSAFSLRVSSLPRRDSK